MSAPSSPREPAECPGVPYLLPGGRVTMAHVLFMDLVAYSQSNTDRQSTLVSELHEVVRSVPEFQAARNANRVIPLDSGDGMMLVFLEDPTAPVPPPTPPDEPPPQPVKDPPPEPKPKGPFTV